MDSEHDNAAIELIEANAKTAAANEETRAALEQLSEMKAELAAAKEKVKAGVIYNEALRARLKTLDKHPDDNDITENETLRAKLKTSNRFLDSFSDMHHQLVAENRIRDYGDRIALVEATAELDGYKALFKSNLNQLCLKSIDESKEAEDLQTKLSNLKSDANIVVQREAGLQARIAELEAEAVAAEIRETILQSKSTGLSRASFGAIELLKDVAYTGGSVLLTVPAGDRDLERVVYRRYSDIESDIAAADSQREADQDTETSEESDIPSSIGRKDSGLNSLVKDWRGRSMALHKV
jgi:small-conductance mechanosensitive channel